MKTLFSLIISILLTLPSFAQIKVVGYFPTYRWEMLSQLDYDHLTHVCASFANPDKEGNLQFEKDLNQFVSSVHNGNCKAIISICGGGDYSWGEKHKIYENLIATPESRTAFISKIMRFMRTYNLDGLDNDMEGNALELKNYNIFSQELADSLHANNLEYSAALGIGGQWGVDLLSSETIQKHDFITTMSYGGVGHWNWKQKPDEATFSKMKKEVDYLISKGLEKEKAIGGIPFYSVEFPKTEQTSYWQYNGTMCDLYNNYASQEPWNKDTIYSPEGHPIYFNSHSTYKKKIDVAIANSSGFMIWELGQDCLDHPHSIIKMIGKYLDSKNIQLDVQGLENIIDCSVDNGLNIISNGLKIQHIKIINTQGVILSESKKTKKIDISNWKGQKVTLEITLGSNKTIQKLVQL